MAVSPPAMNSDTRTPEYSGPGEQPHRARPRREEGEQARLVGLYASVTQRSAPFGMSNTRRDESRNRHKKKPIAVTYCFFIIFAIYP